MDKVVTRFLSKITIKTDIIKEAEIQENFALNAKECKKIADSIVKAREEDLKKWASTLCADDGTNCATYEAIRIQQHYKEKD